MNRPRSSRRRYLSFVEDYKHHRLDHDGQTDKSRNEPDKEASGTESPLKPHHKSRESLRNYIRWLLPHRAGVSVLFALALLAAGLQMIEPLFMRYIVDRVLLVPGLDSRVRFTRLNLAGAVFFSLIILSNKATAAKDYWQRLLNTRLMLALRRSLFERLLHLPLPKLWDMKTGGILSRLSGDVDTTTGLMQLALVSPIVSVIRLLIAIVVLTALNWRLALAALAIIPGVMVISFIFAKRVRSIYRSVRKDAEIIDGWGGRDILRDSGCPGLPPGDPGTTRLYARATHGPA